ncbi:MAG: universal stress protein [Bacteroidetes bacterium]|nr:MAG: universal stress protein [Bacteroidota bacterium]
MSKNIYLVPHDLTAVGDMALRYALHMGKKVNSEIILLHITSSKADSIKAMVKIDEIIAKTEVPYGIELKRVVREGSIFEDIGKIAHREGAQLIIMGTHGSSGLQKLFGSNAIKVVTSADVPFLIVQKNTPLTDIKNIIVPIDLTKESLQIVNVAGDMANIYGASVHVVGEKQNDELLSQQMKNRILIVKNQYDDRSIPCNVELFEKGGSFTKKIMKYVKDKNVDMLAIAYHTESLLPQFDTFAQTLITNDLSLPCMVLNSKPASALYF